MARHQKNVERLQCEHCEMKCANMCNLMMHYKRRHRGKQPPKMPTTIWTHSKCEIILSFQLGQQHFLYKLILSSSI